MNIRIRSPHKMRKTYISTLLNNNMDPDFVRTQAGQKELQTTFNSYTYSILAHAKCDNDEGMKAFTTDRKLQ